MTTLTSLERQVLELMLDRPGKVYGTLRSQLQHAVVARREFTGVGFFTNFQIHSGATVCRDSPNLEIGDVTAEFPSLKHGAGFVLFIRDGQLATLEGYAYGEDWLDEIGEFRLTR